MTKTSFAHGQLRAIVERIERLLEEKAAIAADVKEVYAEAKATGFDTKILRKVVALRKKDAAERQEEEAMIDVYSVALGMAPEPESTDHVPSRTSERAGGEEASTALDAPADPIQEHDARRQSTGQRDGLTEETADGVRASFENESLKSADVAHPIQELPPQSSLVDSAKVTVPVTETEAAPVPIDKLTVLHGHGTLSEEAEQVPADVYDMGNIPAFLDRRKPTAVDYLASG